MAKKQSATKVFEAKAPKLMSALLAAFPQWGVLDAAAAAGNGGAESGGFTKFQELNPTVKGSRGGYGWFQWTGPRRRAYEAWCKKMRLAPDSDDANIRYLIVELKGSESHTIAAVANAVGLQAKTRAFERAFERAGIPHYASRERWAERALAAYKKAGGHVTHAPAKPTPEVISKVQALLKGLGYTEVGGVDGKMGKLTETAILAFRKEHNLTLKPTIDDELIEALMRAEPRKLERNDAPAAVVVAKVPEAKAHWWTRIGAIFGMGASAAAGAVDYIAPASGYVGEVRDYLADVSGYTWFAVILVLALVLYLVATYGQQKSVEAFQSGERR